jgi:8-amino-7-oxononanoate synthase
VGLATGLERTGAGEIHSIDSPALSLDEALARDLAALTRAGLRRALKAGDARRPGTVRLGLRELVDFSANDYLGLAGDPRVARAAVAALADEALGAGSARLISGDHPLHEALERELARFKRTDAALLFNSGYQANVGAIPALVGRRDVIYADALNHASLIDACRLSRAEFRVVPHTDVDAMGRMLAGDRGRFRRRLIVVDGVFSMDGDLAPLGEIVRLAQAHDAWTYVDDAHGTAVLGEGGRGSAEHWSVEGRIDVVMGTLGKALGTVGAFVCGSRTLVDYLLNRARTFIFTTASPPALAAATIEALRIVCQEPWRRTQLRANARRVRDGLRERGHMLEGPPDGHIVPVRVGEADIAVRVGAALRDRGFLVGAIRPPTVPLGASRLRITVSAAHTASQIDLLLTALAETLPASNGV